MPLERKFWEGGPEATTRKPGDLPCDVVLFPAGWAGDCGGNRRGDTVGVVAVGTGKRSELNQILAV
jgi:hypothetical protein